MHRPRFHGEAGEQVWPGEESGSFGWGRSAALRIRKDIPRAPSRFQRRALRAGVESWRIQLNEAGERSEPVVSPSAIDVNSSLDSAETSCWTEVDSAGSVGAASTLRTNSRDWPNRSYHEVSRRWCLRVVELSDARYERSRTSKRIQWTPLLLNGGTDKLLEVQQSKGVPTLSAAPLSFAA